MLVSGRVTIGFPLGILGLIHIFEGGTFGGWGGWVEQPWKKHKWAMKTGCCIHIGMKDQPWQTLVTLYLLSVFLAAWGFETETHEQLKVLVTKVLLGVPSLIYCNGQCTTSWALTSCKWSCNSYNPTWRIIPVGKWLVTPIYKSFRPCGRETTPLRGLTYYGY